MYTNQELNSMNLNSLYGQLNKHRDRCVPCKGMPGDIEIECDEGVKIKDLIDRFRIETE